MRLGIVLRINEIITFEKAVMTVTESPITIAGFNCEVTASAEQIPSTWTRIGLSRLSGLVNASLFCLLHKAIIPYLFEAEAESFSTVLIYFDIQFLSISLTPLEVSVAPVTAST